MLGFFGFKSKSGVNGGNRSGLGLVDSSTLITRYPSNKILFEPTGKGEPLNIELYKMSTHGELFVNSGKACCAPMDGFCVPFSVKKESEFPAISAYGSYGGRLCFLILKIIVFLLPLFGFWVIIWAEFGYSRYT